MKSGKMAKIVLDIALAGTLVAVMATALVQEVPHEWLGIALFVLVIAHVVLNRKWIASVFRGRRSALRVLQIVVVAGLAVCIIGQIASSLVLSKYVFGFLPALPGAGWARRVHMLCSYWMFVLAFVHAGLHIRVPKDMAPWLLWMVRIALVLIACFGVYSFVQLGLWSYLMGQVQFAYADYDTPLALVCAYYASVAVLIAIAFHCIREGIATAGKSKRRS